MWKRSPIGLALLLVVSTAGSSAQTPALRWNELTRQVDELLDRGRHAEAVHLAEEALQIAERTFGVDDQRYATSTFNLGRVYDAGRRFVDAAPLYHRALGLMERVFNRTHDRVLNVLTKMAYLSIEINNLAGAAHGRGSYAEAARLFQLVVSLKAEVLGADSPAVALAINNVASVLLLYGDHAGAEDAFKRALAIREKALGRDHPDVATTLNGLADAHTRQANYPEAERLFLRTISILEKVPQGATLGSVFNNLGFLYQHQNRLIEAERYYLRAKDVQQDQPAEIGIALHNLGTVALAQGKHTEAISRFNAALPSLKTGLGENHPDVANTINSLGSVHSELGDYAEAERYFTLALKLREAAGASPLDFANSYNNLGSVYVKQGRYAQGEESHTRALQILEQKLPPDHPDVATTLNNLAFLRNAQGRNDEAEHLYRRALDIRERKLGPDHADIAGVLSNLATLSIEARKFADAERLLRRALRITQDALGPTHPGTAITLQNLAALHHQQGKPAEAERVYNEALKYFEAAYDAYHPHVGATLWNLGMLLYDEDRPDDATRYFERAVGNLTGQLERAFEYMTEREQIAFAATVDRDFPGFFSFCLTYGGRYPALVGRMYDALLFRKMAITATVAAMRARIAASGDDTAAQLLNALTDKKRQLFRLASSPRDDREAWRAELAQVEQEATRLERDLAKRSSAFANTRKDPPPTWQAVRGRLQPGEAAVEFIRFPFYDGKQWSDTIHYAALVITPTSSAAPSMVRLGEAKTLECGPLNEYSLRISDLLQQQRGVPCPPRDPGAPVALTPTFYQAFWKPLEPSLAGIRRVYVSLDGVLNQVALNVVADESGKHLLDKDVRVVLSTRDLLRPPAKTSARSAFLIGNPLFTVDDAAYVASARRYAVTRGSETASGGAHTPAAGLRGAPWEPLRSAGKELDRVASLLRAERWTLEIHQGKDAVVEAIKTVRAPRLLHVATHGEFAADPAEMRRETFSLRGIEAPGQPAILDDPLLRSGLFFTGANRYRAGLPPLPGADDGVLTAYEASQLNLDGTELVVLSACKTGLGQSRDGEGVFGLRRAFQIAGAQTVLMTMWRVPDEDTQVLMELFYRRWLAGADKHDALRSAQQELRERILRANRGADNPSRWGAFVLVGR